MSSDLFDATVNNDLNLVKRLFSAGADINSYNNCGKTPLHVAVEHGHVEVVKELLNMGANINAETHDGETALFTAAACDKAPMVQVLLESTNIDVTLLHKGISPLHVACEQNYENVVKVLLEDPRCVYYINVTYQASTPLHVAAKFGHKGIITTLLDRNANIDATDGKGRIPLWVAIEKNHIECIKVFLNNSTTNISFPYNDNTPLSYVIQEEKSEIFKLLIRNGADVNITDKNGKTPLHFAAQEDMLDIVRYLYNEKGYIDVNARANNGTTPLHCAAFHGNVEIVTFLVENKADVNAKDENGRTPLHDASQEGALHVIRFLIQNGANVNDITAKGYTPLHFAAKHGRLEVATILIENSANVDAKCTGYYNFTPFHLAVKNNKLDLAKFLLEKSADINAIDPDAHFSHRITNGTLLHWAARYDDIDVIKFLIENGANINATEVDGRTALCLNIKHDGRSDTIRFLIDNGADLNNKQGGTSLYWAVYYCHWPCRLEGVKLLVENGADITSYIDPYGDMKAPLHVTDDLPTVKYLAEKGASINALDKYGSTPLHYTRNLPSVKFLVQTGADVNATNYEGNTPLHGATCVQIVEFLIDSGANVNMPNNEGYTPLHFATSVPMAELLIGNGADFTAITNDGKTVLHTIAKADPFDSISKDLPDLIDFFLDKGINLYAVDNHGNTPLHVCAIAYSSCTLVTRKLLERGADFKAVNYDSKAPGESNDYHGPLKTIFECIEELLTAVKNNEDLQTIRQLANKSDIVNFVEYESKFNLLHYAVKNSTKEVTEFLLKFQPIYYGQLLEKINVNGCSASNWTPLHYAAQQNDSDIVTLLLEYGAIYNSKTEEGYTPLQLTSNMAIKNLLNTVEELFDAVKVGNQDQVAKYLENEKAILNVRDNDCYNPLHWALRKGYHNIVQLFLNTEVDPMQITNDGSTVLHFATSEYNKDTFHSLVKYVNKVDKVLVKRVKKVDKLSQLINSKTQKGMTALHIASTNGCLELVEYILEHGAMYNVKNKEGLTPSALSTNQEVTHLLELVEELFVKAKCCDANIIDMLQDIKPNWFAVVVNACNYSGNTLKDIIEVQGETEVTERFSELVLLCKPVECIIQSVSADDTEDDDFDAFGLFD